MPEEKPKPGPARLHRDQMLARLQDLDRLRDLTEPYITDSRANVRENALPHMPEAERAEAEEIIARTSALIDPPTLAALQQELLSLIAEMDAFYRDVLNREQARGAQADPEELRQAQEVLAALEGYQGQITGLKPGDAGSAVDLGKLDSWPTPPAWPAASPAAQQGALMVEDITAISAPIAPPLSTEPTAAPVC